MEQFHTLAAQPRPRAQTAAHRRPARSRNPAPAHTRAAVSSLGCGWGASGNGSYARGNEETVAVMKIATPCTIRVDVEYSKYGIETISEVSSALTITLGENVHPETVSS